MRRACQDRGIRLRLACRWPFAAKRGASLIEVVIVLALFGVAMPGTLVGLSSLITNTDHVYDRSVLFELAESQMEDVQRQAYQENAANYTTITSPSGYSLSITATPISYTYPSPMSTGTQETLQSVTVTVTGVRGDLSLQAYKVRR